MANHSRFVLEADDAKTWRRTSPTPAAPGPPQSAPTHGRQICHDEQVAPLRNPHETEAEL